MYHIKSKTGVRPTLPFVVLLLLSAFVTSSSAGPLTYEHNYAPDHDYTPKDYSFSYGVKDLHTGDVKQQWEKKDGDLIRGHYSLVEPDGSVRIVDYTADSKSGFNAVVKHKGTSYHDHQHAPKATSHKTFELRPSSQEIHYPQYAFKQDETAADPNYESDVKDVIGEDHEEYTPEVKYVYIPQGDKIDESEYDFSNHNSEGGADGKDADYVSEGTKTSNTYTKYKISAPTKLPIDLNVIKPKENPEAIDVRVVKPIELEIEQVSYDKKQKSSYDVPPYAPGNSQTKPEYLPGPVTFPTDTTSENTNNNNNDKKYLPDFKLSQEDYEKFLNDYYKDVKVNDSSRLTDEEYKKFLNEYYSNPQNNAGLQSNLQLAQIPKNSPQLNLQSGVKQEYPKILQNGNAISQVDLQSGFKPIINGNSNRVLSQGSIPNTYRTNVKPVTTPGLRNYSSNLQYKRQHNNRPKLNYQNYFGNKNQGNELYLNVDNDLRAANARKHRNSGRFVRYAIRRSVID